MDLALRFCICIFFASCTSREKSECQYAKILPCKPQEIEVLVTLEKTFNRCWAHLSPEKFFEP